MEILFSKLKPKLIEFKNINSSIITNYIYQDLSEQKIISYYNNSGLLFFLYDEEYDFYKMYFMVSSLDNLDSLLKQIDLSKSISLEIIKKSKVYTNDLKELLIDNGFKEISTLKRMSSLNSYTKLNCLDEALRYCDLIDIESLEDIFKNKFNKYSDNLPSKKEIQLAVKNKSIIKFTKQNELIGFLWFHNKTYISELKYLFIEEKYRGQNFSKILIEQYLYLTNNIKKKQLWVLTDNNKAINLYKKYGYSFEGLEDMIFVRT